MNLLKLFFIFLRIGAFTFGGGYAMIPLIQDEVVERNKWMTNDEFLDTIAIAQSSPGVLAINTSIMVGYKLIGPLGSLICAIGVALPSFFIMLIVSIYLYQYRENPIVSQVFLGIRPAVAGLIVSAVYKLTKTAKLKNRVLIIPLLAFLGIVLLDISPIFVILAGGIGGVLYYKIKVQASES